MTEKGSSSTQGSGKEWIEGEAGVNEKAQQPTLAHHIAMHLTVAWHLESILYLTATAKLIKNRSKIQNYVFDTILILFVRSKRKN